MARLRAPLRWLLTLALVGVGITHFTTPDPFVRIIPESLPLKLQAVYVSGAVEILGGAAVQLSALRRVAGWGLIALLVAVFPANINMAINEIYLEGMPPQPWLLWARLPLQLVFAAWVWWVCLAGGRFRPD